MRMRHSRAALILSTLILMTTTACGSGVTTSASGGGVGGSAGGGSVGGSAGGAVGGGNAGGGAAAGGVPVPTEINVCHVDFKPSAATSNNEAIGMSWGHGQIIFDVDVECSKAQSRGTLQYLVSYTSYNGDKADLSPKQAYSMAGVQTRDFPFVIPCKAGGYVFEYKWNGTVSGATGDKEDANSSYGVLLTSDSCR